MTAPFFVPLAAGVLQLALAIWLFRESAKAAARTFGFVLIARALSLASLTAMMLGPVHLAPMATALYCAFCFAAVLGVVYFIGVYPAHRRWLPRGSAVPGLLLFASLAAVVVVLVRPGVAIPEAALDASGPVAVVNWMLRHPKSPLGVAPTLLDVIMVVPAFVLVHDYLNARPGRRRDTLLIVSLGFFAPAACSCLIAGALLALRSATPMPADPSVFNYLEMLLFGAWFIVLVVLLGGLAVHVARVRAARERRRAALFGAVLVVATILGATTGLVPDLAGSLTSIAVMVGAWSALGATLVVWGVLRYSLFDIDLTLKVSVRRSTVAAVFVAVYFLVSEGGAVWFSGVSGSQYWGIAAAALLLLALHPIQGFAERLLDRLMPGTEPLGSLGRSAQIAFYREQVDLMWMDGHLSPKDRLVLASLRSRLGLDPETAEAVELEVLASQRMPARS